MALNLIQSQRIAAALEHIRRAQAGEPAAIMYTVLGAWVTFHAGQFALAERLLADLVDRTRGAPMPRQFLARVLLARGAGAAALNVLEPDNPPGPASFSNLARAWVQTGRRDAALAEVRKLEAMGRQGHGVAYDLALIHQELGDRERALAALERAVTDRSMSIGYLRSEPSLASLRDDPRFADVVAQIKFG
jgi:tetratricopeptide (TPR) repeat protein